MSCGERRPAGVIGKALEAMPGATGEEPKDFSPEDKSGSLRPKIQAEPLPSRLHFAAKAG